MKYTHALLLICTVIFTISRLSAQEYRLSGTLRSRQDSSSIGYAHIYSSHLKNFTVSNQKGEFSIEVSVGDTLIFSDIRHSIYILTISQKPSQDSVTVWMYPRTYLLEEITIYAREELKGFYGHQRIDYTQDRSKIFRPTTPTSSLGSTDPGTVGITIEGLLTSILEPFTSRYKQLEKVYIIRQAESLERYYKHLLTQRLSYAWLSQHLPLLRGEEDAFLRFWKPEAILLEVANEYELIQTLTQAYERYHAHLLRKYSYRSYKDRVSTLRLRDMLEQSRLDSLNQYKYSRE